MRKTLLAILIVFSLMILCSCAVRNRKFGHIGNDSALTPVLSPSGSSISQTPPGVMIRFEAIVVNRPSQKCIELYIPEEFEKYDGDPKWAISSTLGFELGFFEMLGRSGAIVTGKYMFVKDIHDGPSGIVTGKLFEISGIEYF